MLSGCAEFIRALLFVKGHIWQFLNLVELAQKSGVSESVKFQYSTFPILPPARPRQMLNKDKNQPYPSMSVCKSLSLSGLVIRMKNV